MPNIKKGMMGAAGASAVGGESLFAWGANSGGGSSGGKLGLGDILNRSSPVQVGDLTDWLVVGAGHRTTSVVKSDGSLWSWGVGNSGVTGHGNTTNLSSPVQVGALTDWFHVASGSMTIGIKTASFHRLFLSKTTADKNGKSIIGMIYRVLSKIGII